MRLRSEALGVASLGPYLARWDVADAQLGQGSC